MYPLKLTPQLTGPEYSSKPPSLKTVEVNLHGVLYTAKLAMHAFIRQNGTDGPSSTQTDTSLTLIGSGAAFLDCLRGVQYQSTKWGARGIMHALRRTTHFYGSRVNMISPW
jgi:NAD(P)-dependent dehydrogenase (short-subunit alcohol dehydrogenase family)